MAVQFNIDFIFIYTNMKVCLYKVRKQNNLVNGYSVTDLGQRSMVTRNVFLCLTCEMCFDVTLHYSLLTCDACVCACDQLRHTICEENRKSVCPSV